MRKAEPSAKHPKPNTITLYITLIPLMLISIPESSPLYSIVNDNDALNDVMTYLDEQLDEYRFKVITTNNNNYED